MTPRIYVASLSDYNAGMLHGRWIDCDQGVEHIQEETQAMLAESKEPIAEEWAIHDYEGFHGVKIEEYSDFESVAELAELLAEHGGAYAVFCDHEGINHATVERFQDAYCGEFKDEEDYAYHIVEECYELDGPLAMYFDYEKFARDLFINDCYGATDEDGQFHVFHRF